MTTTTNMVSSLTVFSDAENLEKEAGDGALIGTHSGAFHCDESVAVAMLKFLPKYRNSCVFRSRDLDLLKHCAILVDVGGVYEADSLRFDHHQRGFAEVYPGTEIKMSSAGLVYLHLGREVIRGVLLQHSLISADADETEKIAAIHEKVYSSFVQEVDAIDNGIEATEKELLKYRIHTNLSSRVARLNPVWNEPSNDDFINERFKQAVAMTGEEFTDTVLEYAKSWWPAKNIVMDSIAKRFSVHPSGHIVKLSEYIFWKDHFYDWEESAAAASEASVYYVILQLKNQGEWRVTGVSESRGSFKTRKPLPEKWRGLSHQQLVDVAKIPDCTFVHNSGFIGGNLTEAGILEMAIQAIAEP